MKNRVLSTPLSGSQPILVMALPSSPARGGGPDRPVSAGPAGEHRDRHSVAAVTVPGRASLGS